MEQDNDVILRELSIYLHRKISIAISISGMCRFVQKITLIRKIDFTPWKLTQIVLKRRDGDI
ncbi:MAG: hypothetical protein ACP8RL_02005 [cyanobacterium endosymbiont of Rhopalodia inflata]